MRQKYEGSDSLTYMHESAFVICKEGLGLPKAASVKCMWSPKTVRLTKIAIRKELVLHDL